MQFKIISSLILHQRYYINLQLISKEESFALPRAAIYILCKKKNHLYCKLVTTMSSFIGQNIVIKIIQTHYVGVT